MLVNSNDAMEALNFLLSRDYAHFQKCGNDDYRDPKDDGLSLSTKGWYDHKSGESGSIFSLAQENGWKSGLSRHSTKIKTTIEPSDNSKSAARLWQNAETESAKERTRSYLTEQRKIPLENFEDLLGTLIRSTENQGKQILMAPMLTPDQALKAEIGNSFSVEKIHRLIFQGGDKPEKKQLGGGDEVGRITYFPPRSGDVESLEYLVCEGLEDALSVRAQYPDHHFLICQSKGNFRHVPNFLPEQAQILILSDHDGHDDLHQNGEIAAAKLRQELIQLRFSCDALMPASPKDDANRALQRGELQDWLASLVVVPELSRSKNDFYLESISALKVCEPDWLIKGVIEKRTLAAIIGESGSGKSFLALDFACCVATGKAWHGRETHKGDVVYLAGEGRNGLIRRAGAWRGHHQESTDRLFLSSKAIDLGDSRTQLLKVRQALQALEKPPVLIVIDTLARHNSGDENSASEMSSFVNNLGQLSEEFKATILIIHHAGKDPSRGARGSSAFRAALDFEIVVTKPDTGVVNVQCEKAKDSEPFAPLGFKLSSAEVIDEQGRLLAESDGTPIRSCVLEPAEYVKKQQTRKTTGYQKIFIKAFEELSQDSENTDRVLAEKLRERVRNRFSDKSNEEFKGIWRNMKNAKLLNGLYNIDEAVVIKRTDPTD